jgi:hypothetical protein
MLTFVMCCLLSKSTCLSREICYYLRCLTFTTALLPHHQHRYLPVFPRGHDPPPIPPEPPSFPRGGGAATTTTLTGKTDGPIPHQPRRVTWSISMGEAAIYEVETAISAATTCTTAKPLPAGAIHTIFQIRMVFSGRVAWPGPPAGPGPAKIL